MHSNHQISQSAGLQTALCCGLGKSFKLWSTVFGVGGRACWNILETSSRSRETLFV